MFVNPQGWLRKDVLVYLILNKDGKLTSVVLGQSVCLSVNNTYLFVRFTCIFYNSKSDKMKLQQ